jgi:hypothetical protein
MIKTLSTTVTAQWRSHNHKVNMSVPLMEHTIVVQQAVINPLMLNDL